MNALQPAFILQIIQKFLQRTGRNPHIFVRTAIVEIEGPVHDGIARREDATIVEPFRLIPFFRRQNRFGSPGQHLQRILPVKQQCTHLVSSRSSVSHAVIDHEPALIRQNRRCTSADLLLPGTLAAGNQEMTFLIFPLQDIIRKLDPD